MGLLAELTPKRAGLPLRQSGTRSGRRWKTMPILSPRMQATCRTRHFSSRLQMAMHRQVGSWWRGLGRRFSATLDAALSALPARQRQAVVMRHIEGFSNPEIAEIMDIGVEAVESLTARGKRALKNALYGKREELGFEDDRKHP